MNTNTNRPIGFRKAAPWQGAPNRVGWRFWVGPLLIARTPGIGLGVSVGWTRPTTGDDRQRADHFQHLYLRESFTFDLGDGTPPFPFIEDENANITGYGHQDRASFAEEINRYDSHLDETFDDEAGWTADDISHGWVSIDPGDQETLRLATENTYGAIPVTTLWGAR